ncbi:OsmC family protein [Halothermothrix orenii]|uniref:OsmC family protein n=1 Tax=Halothermothrix orenii (strain H 168 / OCM 544 / DSM 9562) TaxID=373903 RepID=B8D1F8_HALOH|nr:OsmC family protein [Halothermothrix orenii]ACL69035.1 OsmC family protein [Halothermothrix orenii H 168]
MKTKVVWQGGLKFIDKFDDGQEILMGSSENSEGVSPLKLLLTGVAGCTGIDIIMILEKMRLNVEKFSIVVEGVRADEHPRRFIEIDIKYILKGDNLSEDKVERAIELSIDKYCSASNSLNSKINYSYVIE